MEIRCELWFVYSQNVMSEGQINLHNEELSVQPSVVSDDLFQRVFRKFAKDGSSLFRTSSEVPQISCTVLSEIVTVRIG
jgi:hypothetical protein